MIANGHREPPRAAAAPATSRRCWRPATSAANAPISTPCSSASAARWASRRDVYGLRLAPSAFPYKELGANSANLKGAQHCRAEVYLVARLGGHGPGRRTQGDAPGNGRVDQGPEASRRRAGTRQSVWPLGRQLGAGTPRTTSACRAAAPSTLPFLMYPNGENASGAFDSCLVTARVRDFGEGNYGLCGAEVAARCDRARAALGCLLDLP